jgi:uncharacterized LabA/DUF88 family protein
MRKGFKNLPRNVILVTGDQDFTKLIAQLKQHGFNIIVVLTDQSLNTGAFLGQHADMIWTFDDFRKGMEPIFKKVLLYFVNSLLYGTILSYHT